MGGWKKKWRCHPVVRALKATIYTLALVSKPTIARDWSGCADIFCGHLAKSRLERREDGTLVVGLKREWSDGTTALVFSPLEFVERLVALVPPPRANQILYRGVLAGNAAWRAEVIPTPKVETADAAAARRAKRLRA